MAVAGRGPPPPRTGGSATASGARDALVLRPNVAGRQRTGRLALLYLVTLTLLYAGFLAFDLASAGGSRPGVRSDLLIFGLVAVVLGAGGAIYSIAPAPRAVGIGPQGLVLIDRFGRRSDWPPLGVTSVRVVRRHPAGKLARAPVESVELSAPGRRTVGCLVEEGLLPSSR